MRAAAAPVRILLAGLACASFLAAALAPCPPPARAATAHAEHPAPVPEMAEHGEGCPMQAGPAWTAPCPCGCGERSPMAGSPARLGVALLPAPPRLERPVLIVAAPQLSPALFDCFVPAIDHVPLPV